MTDADQRPRPAAVPDKPAIDGLEAVWSVRWEADQVYAFDRTRPRSEVFSIDTPPPTVSGSLHVGHAFSYTHTDIIARFRRMTGMSVWVYENACPTCSDPDTVGGGVSIEKTSARGRVRSNA